MGREEGHVWGRGGKHNWSSRLSIELTLLWSMAIHSKDFKAGGLAEAWLLTQPIETANQKLTVTVRSVGTLASRRLYTLLTIVSTTTAVGCLATTFGPETPTTTYSVITVDYLLL